MTARIYIISISTVHVRNVTPYGRHYFVTPQYNEGYILWLHSADSALHIAYMAHLRFIFFIAIHISQCIYFRALHKNIADFGGFHPR